jgi:hypothetical protein
MTITPITLDKAHHSAPLISPLAASRTAFVAAARDALRSRPLEMASRVKLDAKRSLPAVSTAVRF